MDVAGGLVFGPAVAPVVFAVAASVVVLSLGSVAVGSAVAGRFLDAGRGWLDAGRIISAGQGCSYE